jgi:hypothetical protein
MCTERCANVAVAELPLLFFWNVLLLRVAEGPCFIDLYPASVNIADLGIVVSRDRTANIFEQL